MHERWGVLVGAVGFVMAAGLSLHAAEAVLIPEPAEASIVVRTYTQPDSEGDIRSARRTASAILERVRIRVEWVECGVPAAASAPDVCLQPLRWNELVVRVVSAGTVDSPAYVDSLGFAFVDLEAGGGWLATVYADRVSVMARAAGVDAAELLGRAMAHEVGHLLLGTNRHTQHGLMRASWSGADLRRNRAAQWLFGGDDGEVMRRGITSRARHEREGQHVGTR